MSKVRVTALIALAVVVLAACGGGSDTPAKSDTKAGATKDVTAVAIKTSVFTPDPIEVKAGTKVTWTNDDEIPHTVTAGLRTYHEDGISKGQTKEITKTGAFDEQLDGKDSTFSFTFDAPGTYTYLCTIHPGMDATVTVS